MSLDKVLHKIQEQIKELAPMLEPFVEETIQPSVADCESLQKQLTQLQENLAVYKYQKKDKELSPSFNIHAKVSAQEKTEEKTAPPPPVKEVVAEPVKKAEPVVESKPVAEVKPVNVTPVAESKPIETRPVEKPIEKPVEKRVETKAPEPERQRGSHLVIGINDKFRFINMLFSQNSSEYNIAIEQLSNTRNWHEAEIYLNSLKNLYDWKENNEVVKLFYSIVKKRFE